MVQKYQIEISYNMLYKGKMAHKFWQTLKLQLGVFRSLRTKIVQN
jgi:hypothetical protein